MPRSSPDNRLREVGALVERFSAQERAYRSSAYNETQVRREFLDQLFESLGWDVSNRQGKPEGLKDVIHEDRLRIENTVKAPDYCFTLSGVRKFFVEAKKPSVNIAEDQAPAYQLRRYAWSANMPLGILTDFEEFAVYDCRIKPQISDRASTARLFIYTYRDFVEKWDEIEQLFSRTAVQQGSLDRFAAEAEARGTSRVDKAFLAEIESWRSALAAAIFDGNPGLSLRELNFAVTRTIDRIIFLRISEDRGSEPYGQLRDILSRDQHNYAALLEIFDRADQKYNSGLFHFEVEPNRPEAPDTLTPRLRIADDALASIIENLYFPESPYEFSVLPAETLGSVYEQFIGSVIEISSTDGVLIEEKPEIAHSGGVTYTPSFIVEAIVPKVLDPILEGKTPAQVEHVRVLDPACGSGTFLLAAYQHLLDWHLARYLESTSTVFRARVYETSAGETRLTIQERKRILLNNVFGVDVDGQAVEVAKLSLLLKVLEGESDASLNAIQLFHERALPDLGANLKSGNSLVAPNVLGEVDRNQLDEATLHRVNPFDWEAAFPTAMESGGFDAIVGNPPYIRVQTMHEYAPIEVEYLQANYTAGGDGNFDVYAVFVEKGLQLLNSHGRLGFILPHKFFNAEYGAPLRGLLSAGSHVDSVTHFGHQQVFENRSTYTCLLFLTKHPNDEVEYEQVDDLVEWDATKDVALRGDIPASRLTSAPWQFVVGPEAGLFERLSAEPRKLSDVTTRIYQGLKTGADRVFIVEEVEAEQVDTVLVHSRATGSTHRIEAGILHQLYKGGDVRAFEAAGVTRRIIFPYRLDGDEAKLITPAAMERQYPFAWDYLNSNKGMLERRDRGRMEGPEWYGYSRNQALQVMPRPKIFCRELTPRAAYVADPDGTLYFTGGTSGGYGLIPDGVSEKYLLGVLNSSLLDWWVKRNGTALRGGFYSFEARFIRDAPIRLGNAATRRRVEDLVDRIYEIRSELEMAELSETRGLLDREASEVKKLVDEQIFDLFDLDEDERSAVMNAVF